MSGLDNTSLTIRKTSVATTITDNDLILLCTPTASFTVTLPLADPAQPGQIFYVTQSNVAGNQVTLAGAGGQTIDGSATLVVGPVATKAAIKVVSDGSNWFTF